MNFRLIATARTPQDIANGLNVRRQELALSMNELDCLLGFAERYTAKIFATGYRKNLGHLSLPAMLDALGCSLAIVANDDLDALPPIVRRALNERTCGGNKIQCSGRLPRPDAA